MLLLEKVFSSVGTRKHNVRLDTHTHTHTQMQALTHTPATDVCPYVHNVVHTTTVTQRQTDRQKIITHR